MKAGQGLVWAAMGGAKQQSETAFVGGAFVGEIFVVETGDGEA